MKKKETVSTTTLFFAIRFAVILMICDKVRLLDYRQPVLLSYLLSFSKKNIYLLATDFNKPISKRCERNVLVHSIELQFFFSFCCEWFTIQFIISIRGIQHLVQRHFGIKLSTILNLSLVACWSSTEFVGKAKCNLWEFIEIVQF